MSRSVRFLSLVLCLVGLGLSSSGFALNLRTMDWAGLERGFVADHESLSGYWKDKIDWKGVLCRKSSYNYLLRGKAKVKSVVFDLNDEGELDVYADLNTLYGRAEAQWKTSSTLCQTLGGWLGLGIERAEIFARVTFLEDKDHEVTGVKVRVLSTKFGTIHVGKRVPHWLEKRMTRVVNSSFEELWASRLGDWLTDKVVQAVRKQIEGAQ